jgi:hypothetical protein
MSSSSSSVWSAVVADTSSSAYYNGQQQAWRMLGIYVDCSSLVSIVDTENQQQDQDKNNGAATAATCQRYLLWAAYIDTNYQGSGSSSGEYQYYNTDTQSWDDSACSSSAAKAPRCARLDCHLSSAETASTNSTSSSSSSTNWQLLGVYKEYYYASEWFEQLFKHLGYCVWDNATTYSYMQTYYASWPQACVVTATSSSSSSSSLYYIDLAPGPVLRLALYTDSVCFTEQTSLTVAQQDDILAASGYLTSTQVAAFNQHLLRFAACQPCLASYINGQDCQDDAGYTNVNQCMKFRTHTQLQAATLADLQTALTQGAILSWSFHNDETIYSPLWPGVLEYAATKTTSQSSVDNRDTVPAAQAVVLATLAKLYTSSSSSSITSIASASSLARTSAPLVWFASSWYNVGLAALVACLATTLLLRVVASKWSATLERRRQWWRRHRRRLRGQGRENGPLRVSKKRLSRRPLESASEPLM